MKTINISREISEKSREFWKSVLDGYSRNKLPFNISRKRINGIQGIKIIQRNLGKNLMDNLEKQAKKYSCTVRDICLCAHVYLLGIISCENDIVTGVTTHDRHNSIPLRTNINKNINGLDLLKDVSKSFNQSIINELFLADIANIIEDVSDTENPIFDTIFNFTHMLEVKSSNSTGNTLFDLEVTKTLDYFTVNIKYSPNYFYDEDIETALNLYVRILELFGEDVNRELKVENLMTQSEKDKLVFDFNNTKVEYPKNKTINRIFEEQVEKTPHNKALIFGGQSMSYLELNARSNQIARVLLEKGVKNKDNVAVIVNRGFDMIIGIMAVLKCGGAYVPIDPEYPSLRKDYIIENSNCTAVLADDKYDIKFGNTIKIESDGLDQYSCENLNIEKDSHDLAYIIYTSGSTGNPKGVMIEHHSAVNLIKWVNTEYKIGTKDALLFITSMCFDLSVYDIFGILASGGRIVIANKEQIRDPEELYKLLKNEKITFWDSVPSTMDFLVNVLKESKEEYCQEDLRLVFLSGDWIPVKLPEQIKEYFPNAKVISLGGATEATVWSNYYPIDKVTEFQTSIPYGRPLDNNYFYILDENRDLVPQGVAGELYIGGVGVARGYMNDERSITSFIRNPFISDEMMYKTGDLGRMMPDGNMEFLGRIDHQVKIRGFRIELGEIEAQLLKHRDLKHVAVIAMDIDGAKELVAYIVANDEMSSGQLREFLSDKLPYYMIPSYYVQLEKIPVNSNGKIDRKALPNPVGKMRTGAEFIEASTEEEKIMAEIWKKVLHVSEVSILDNFFDLGGNSLQGELVCGMANKKGINIEVSDLFKKGCISKILESDYKSANNQFDLVQDMYNLKEVDNLTEIKGKDAISMYNLTQYSRKAELPAVAQNDITTYLHRSLPLCAIMGNENYKGWIYSNYIQVFSYRDARGFLELNYLEPRDSFADVSDVICLGYHLLKHVDNIVDFIKEKIQFGYYLIIHLDEYELSNKNDYMKNHYVHASIVYGYDDDTRQIKGVGFDKGRLFNDLIFDYDEINKAFASGKIHYTNYAPWCAWSAVQLIKFKSPDKPFPFSKKKFMQDLSEYIHSISDEYRLFSFEYDVKRVKFGMNVYDDLVNELKDILNGQFNVDYRALHLLSEHKKCLYERIAYVIEKYNLSTELINKNKEFYELYLKFEDLRTKFLGQIFQEFNLCQLSKEQRNVIEKSSDQILTIKDQEYKLLNEIYELLSVELK